MVRAERARGFTLLEVLVALAIASIALTSAIKVIGIFVGNSARLQERIYAHWAAENVFVEGQIEKPWPESGTEKGEIELVGRVWYWRKTVTETQYSPMRRIEIEILDRADDKDYVARLVGYAGENVKW